MQTEKIQQYKEMEWFSRRVKESSYSLSEHAFRFVASGKLGMSDISEVLVNGSVMEERQNPIRGTSYLVYGESNGKPIHIVCAVGSENNLIVVFAYIPKLPVWSSLTKRNDLGGMNMTEATESLGKCYFCGGDMKTITMGNFDYRREGLKYVIKKIPANLCLQCGEKYLEADIGEKLNQMIDDEQFSGEEQANVINYQ